MTDNRTLGDFGGDSEGDDSSAAAGEAESADGSTEPADGVAESPDGSSSAPDGGDESVDGTPRPATVTYSWSPDGDACADCGQTVDTRWRAGEGADDPDAMVCPDCKRW